jgi:hypothetical protein
MADDASIAEIAALLSGRRISAVPIVDRFDVVIGLVSWTDLHDKIDIGEPEHTARGGWLRRWRPPRLRWPQVRAAGATMPPVGWVIGPGRTTGSSTAASTPRAWRSPAATVNANLCNQRQDLAIALWECNAVGRHVTNIVVAELQEDATHVISQGHRHHGRRLLRQPHVLRHAGPGRARLAHHLPADPRFETL